MSNEKLDKIVDSKIIDYLSEHPIEFNIGDIIYLKTDSDQKARMVTSIQLSSNGINYEVVSEINPYWAQGIEISKDKNFVTKTND